MLVIGELDAGGTFEKCFLERDVVRRPSGKFVFCRALEHLVIEVEDPRIGDHRLMAGVERTVVKTGVGLRPGTLSRELELG